MMEDQGRYRALLRSARPDLSSARFAYLGEGWDNVLFELDDGRIARFAKGERTSRMLETEAALLQTIGPRLPVPVPIAEFVARSPASPDVALMIYRRIPGSPLGDVAWDDALVAGVAPALARFLDVLHAVAWDEVRTSNILRFSTDGWVERHRALYQQTRNSVRQGLNRTAFIRFEAWWRDYLTEPGSRAFDPCLVHGDLVPEHVLLQSEPWRLSGIIDFGDAMWADPVLDLAGLPEPLARAVAAQMESLTLDRAVWRRRDAYHRIAPLHAVFAGLQLARADLLRSGVEALQRDFGPSEFRP